MLAVIRAKMLPPDPVFTDEELSNFGGWVKATGMKPEGARDFDLSKYPYQRDLYNEDRAAFRSRVVIMKAAQTGLTVKLLNRSMWLTADVRRQINVGLGFPTQDAVEKLAASRFKPQLYTSARMIELMRGVGDSRLKKDSVGLVRLGISNMRFLGLRSGVSADSNPLDAELVDEVRLVPAVTVERFKLRVTESTLIDRTNGPRNGARGIIELNSTAGFPNQDIHRYFLDSTQGWWATPCPDHKCRRSRTGVILAREFASNPGKVIGRRDDGRYYLKCPTCGAHITDDMQQRGFYIHENPEAMWLGYHFSQLVKGEDHLNTFIMPSWNLGINMPEFYNSVLGLPYMDTDAIPATKEIIERCCDDTLAWVREPPGRDGKWRAMGIDQRAPEKHIVIKSLDQNGVEVLEHVQILEASGLDAAAKRIVKLAKDWGVSIVVIDGEPSYDLAVEVGRLAPKGLVWLSDYADNQDDIVQWDDKRRDQRIRKSTGEVKYEYRVVVDRYKGIDWSLGMFARGKIRLPRRSEFYELRQERTIGGVLGFASVSEEFVTHLSDMARYKVQKEVSIGKGEKIAIPGEYVLRWRWMTVEDPHFVHANLSASVGLARRKLAGGVDSFHLPEPSNPGPLEAGIPEQLRPSTIQPMLAERTRNTCGRCRFYNPQSDKEGHCKHPLLSHRQVTVGAADVGCEEFLVQKEA